MRDNHLKETSSLMMKRVMPQIARQRKNFWLMQVIFTSLVRVPEDPAMFSAVDTQILHGG